MDNVKHVHVYTSIGKGSMLLYVNSQWSFVCTGRDAHK